MLPDLLTTRHLLRTGQTQPQAEIERAIDAAQSARCHHAFLATLFDEARAVASLPDIRKQPLAGLAVSVKDLFDMAGQTTSAGSVVLRGAPGRPACDARQCSRCPAATRRCRPHRAHQHG